ncbi:hypothetical protein SAMN05444266_101632 [Chitinophaga jiangningensis]|uniref:Uncharacterized protein n=1 Tax=Chitinophaga jiangningensis TaxID=1419482 RepID=A0A1M6WID3_9BACT|nr:hypothetical protein SAMN05444266_101632 [Chitinophaga jiangningensis]
MDNQETSRIVDLETFIATLPTIILLDIMKGEYDLNAIIEEILIMRAEK